MRKPNEKHPLAGTRILVGRARHQAGSLSASLRSLGASVIEIPFIEIRKPQSYQPLDDALKNIKSYDWLILTSANGVEAMWGRIASTPLALVRMSQSYDLIFFRASSSGWYDCGFRISMNGISITDAPRLRKLAERLPAW